MVEFAALEWQMPNMSWHEGGLFMGMHWLWWGFWILLVAVLLVAFWRLMADRSTVRRRVVEEERAEEVLRERFARGEITQDEYAQKMKVLRETFLGR